MNEVSAAMGLASLESIEDFIAINYRNYGLYGQVLEGLPGIHLIRYDPNEKLNYQYVILEVDEAEASISRDELVQVLHAENVLARRYFFPGCHRMEPYRSRYPDPSHRLPNTQRLAQRVLALPTGSAVSPDDIVQIGEVIHTVVTYGAEIKAGLSKTTPCQT
jgi:dTDP-4-amino-4,6-dideoxygalactose transaminase